MDIPSPFAGTVQELRVQVGDRVGEGRRVLLLDGEGAAPSRRHWLTNRSHLPKRLPRPGAAAQEPARAVRRDRTHGAAGRRRGCGRPRCRRRGAGGALFQGPHAGPSVRRLARELGVDLNEISGTGPKGRITKQDLLGAVRGPERAGCRPGPCSGRRYPGVPARTSRSSVPSRGKPLRESSGCPGRICTGRGSISRTSPTTTRRTLLTSTPTGKQLDTEARGDGYRVTLLAFLIKASMSALREFPKFNSSLTPEKDALIYKSYYNIDVAVDTPDGLVVPVIRDVDRKGIREISQELAAVSVRAREGKLSPPTSRAAVSRSPASAVSAVPASRQWSTPRRWRSSAWSAPGLRRCGTARRSCRD